MEENLQNDLIKKLDYIGLDLDNISSQLLEFKPLEFNLSRLNDDKNHKVFRYLKISKIDIILSPSLRDDSVHDKYSSAMPLASYLLNDDTNEWQERNALFIEALRKLDINDIETISNLQNEMKDKEPFNICYSREHLWQIYYSDATDRYFMMVPLKESNLAEFFYLLKRKIEVINDPSKDEEIFVPINYVNYSEKYLDRDEIVDIENYLWIFTKNWPTIYEVYDKNEVIHLDVLGKLYVYDRIESTYKVKLLTKDDSISFYNFLKALFILQTETKDSFTFVPEINSKNELEFYYNDEKVNYLGLEDFITDEYCHIADNIKLKQKEIKKLEKDLTKKKEEANKCELSYLEKQKQIGLFVECKKSFSGRLKLFFRPKKIVEEAKEEAKKESNKYLIDSNEEEYKYLDQYDEGKSSYTIEDLVYVASIYERLSKRHYDLTQDLNAICLRLKSINKKLENANTYIEEIDKHRKSIFDFWKFTKKDDEYLLEEGKENLAHSENEIKKVFDIEEDLEELGVKVDKAQRSIFTKEELDYLFIAKNKDINSILNEFISGNNDKIKELHLKLKDELNSKQVDVSTNSMEIFGNMLADSRRTRYIGSRSHRENEKNEYNILNVSLDDDEFLVKIGNAVDTIKEAIKKHTTPYDLSLYMLKNNEKLDKNALYVMNIDEQNEFENYECYGEERLNLIKINIKKGMPLVFYSNILLYDNKNETLPEGMDLSRQVLLDTSCFEFNEVKRTKFKTNSYFKTNSLEPNIKDIEVFEYDVEVKK